jgi:hypothetical protein
MTREQIETLITDNITTNSNGEITAVKVKAILDAIANDYRHSTDEITLSQVTDLVSSLAGKQATLTATNIKTIVDSLVEMTTPINADNIIVTDSTGTTAKKISWTNIKSFLKTYFDTLYQVILVSGTNIKTINGSSILGSGDLVISSDNIYTANGTLSGARTVTMSGNGLTFNGGQTTTKGAGTTSATTSLLVQNSSSSTFFQILDNGKFTLGTSVTSFDNTCVAIGNTITSSATKSIVIGSDGATASAFGAIRLGAFGTANGQSAISIGYNASANVAGVSVGESSSTVTGVSLGYNTTGLGYSTAIQGISSATHNIILGTSIYINTKINDIANSFQVGINGAESGNNILCTSDGLFSINNNAQPVSAVSFPSSGTNIFVNNLGVNPTSNVGAVQQYVNYKTISVASSTAGATATGTANTKILTFSVGANMSDLTVGKILRISGGSGRPVTFYRIVSVSGQNVTLDGYLKNVFATSFNANTTSTTSSVTIVSGLQQEFRNDLGTTIKLYQETTAVTSSVFVANMGNNVKDDSTFDGYTVAQVVKALRNLGILA